MGQYKRKIKKGTRWFYSGQYLGQKYHSKAIYLTKGECAKAERERLKELDAQARNPVNDIKLKVLMEDRLDEIKAKKSKDYYRENHRYFKRVLAEFGDIYVSELSKSMANALLIKEANRLKRTKKSNFKVNSMLRALKALFNYGNKIYDLDLRNPFNLDFYPIDINLKYIPPAEHIEAVKAECTDKQRLLIEFVDETGCRIMEAVRFKYSDIDGDLITLWTRKSRNSNLTPRRIPKPDCITEIGKGKVFPYGVLPRFLERKIVKLNLPVFSWHNLRHRRASLWANAGMSLFEISHRLGHTNLKTTQGYLQLLGYSKS
ncbi:MAG: hypothetical protein C4519_24475 [Desulfobacteraceae bacterium]|nr:MAG: hypothetical protein C4519_24475 [Desulfobacteraceae bacterium]